MSDSYLQIILAIIGSGIITAIISEVFALVRKSMDKKSGLSKELDELKTEINDLKKKGSKNELDSVRLQMLVMMADYPNDTSEIMRIAEHYFKDLKGNWYLTSMFNRWLEENGIAKPEWFNGNDKGGTR